MTHTQAVAAGTWENKKETECQPTVHSFLLSYCCNPLSRRRKTKQNEGKERIIVKQQRMFNCLAVYPPSFSLTILSGMRSECIFFCFVVVCCFRRELVLRGGRMWVWGLAWCAHFALLMDAFFLPVCSSAACMPACLHAIHNARNRPVFWSLLNQESWSFCSMLLQRREEIPFYDRSLSGSFFFFFLFGRVEECLSLFLEHRHRFLFLSPDGFECGSKPLPLTHSHCQMPCERQACMCMADESAMYCLSSRRWRSRIFF